MGGRVSEGRGRCASVMLWMEVDVLTVIDVFALAGDCYAVGTALAMVNDRVREDGSMVPRKRLEDHVIYQPSVGYLQHLQRL